MLLPMKTDLPAAAGVAAWNNAAENSHVAWRALEQIPGQAAVEASWRQVAGDAFPAMRAALLERDPGPATRVPCPRSCGCAHVVIRDGPGDLVGVCDCDPWNCDDLPLRAEDTVVWRLSWPHLARGLCRALELEPQAAGFELANTRQIGSWSAGAVPVICAVQTTPGACRQVIAELAARLRRPFILLLPTRRLLNANALEVLAHCGAAEFDLESNFLISPAGTLQCRRRPGELFARFNAEPEAMEQETAQQAFALVRQLDQEQPLRPPSVLTTFRLYCMEELSTGAIARKFGCSRATVVARLKTIKDRIGADPSSLRRYSAHLAGLDHALAQPGARRIRPRDLIYDAPEERE